MSKNKTMKPDETPTSEAPTDSPENVNPDPDSTNNVENVKPDTHVERASTQSGPAPGTKGYAGLRHDARKQTLAVAIKRLGRGRGEVPLLAKMATLAHDLIYGYDEDETMATSSIAGETESFFGAAIARLHVIADEREAEREKTEREKSAQ